MEKMAWDGPKWGQEDFFPTNPDLADILGDMDFDFENFYFLDFVGSKISRFPGPRFPNFQKSGLGPAWARLGPGLGPGLGLRWPRLGPRLGPRGPLSDPKLTPLPTHPGIKYVARILAATKKVYWSQNPSIYTRAPGFGATGGRRDPHRGTALRHSRV